MSDEKRIHVEGHDVTITIGGVEVQGWADPFWAGDGRDCPPDGFSVGLSHTIELTMVDDEAAREFFKLTPEEEAEQVKFRNHIDDVLSGEFRPVTDYVKISTNLQAVSGCKPTPITRTRLCTHCNEPSVDQSGNRKRGKLCRKHAAQSRARSEASKAQPNCRCGSKAAYGQPTCRRCAEVDQAHAETERAERLVDKAIARIREIASGLEYCNSPSAYCDELIEIAETLEVLK